MASLPSAAQIDLLSLAEDRYLVRLLVQALELRQVQVIERQPGKRPRSDIGIGVLTKDGLSVNEWQAHLADYPMSTLIAFERDSSLPEGAAYEILGWPARSSDPAVAKLAELLRNGQVPDASEDSSTGRGRGRKASDPSPMRVFSVLAGFVLAAVLLWPRLTPDAVQEPSQDPATQTMALEPSQTLIALSTSSTSSGPSQAPASASPGAGALALPERLHTEAATTRSRLSSTIARYCAANTPAAARAWLGVFSREDRQQALQVPCVHRQLQRFALQ